MKDIYEIAKSINIDKKYVIPFGLDKGKIDLSLVEEVKGNKAPVR